MDNAIKVSEDPFILISRDGSLEVATMELPMPGGGTQITSAVFRDGRTLTRIRSVSRTAARVTHDALVAAYKVAVGQEELWAMTALESLAARGYLQVHEGRPFFSLKGDALWQRLQPISPLENRPIRVEVQVPDDAWTPADNLPEKCQQCAVRKSVREACLGVGLGQRRSHRQAEAGVTIAEVTPGQREDGHPA